ncbi:hypothetical protein [Lactiplantibacillus plantarum]|uniref:hypothetical protein n=1 Tax=Lactiplantibacillus plantarum TaxID=1590 RepID=UPI00223F04C3|nr:hypothetical protein [Lactiplantibacillus plantarum]
MVNTILKEADLFCPNSVRINFTIYLKLKYYVYQVEKGPLSETLTIEIDVTFNKSDFDNWPTYDPAESFGITLAATLSVAVIISMAPAIAGSASAAGVVAAFVALATKFLTNNKG